MNTQNQHQDIKTLKAKIQHLKKTHHKSKAGDTATLQITAIDTAVGTTVLDAYPALPADGWGYRDRSGEPVIITASPDDINQGQIANCYFLADLLVIADSDPAYISTILRPEVDAAGVVVPGKWVVYFTRAGVITRVHIDCMIDNIQNRSGSDGDFWPAMIEKAYAFYRYGLDTFMSENYGWMSDVFLDLGLLLVGVNQDLVGIMVALKEGYLVTFGTVGSPPNGEIIGNHAYGVLSYAEQPDKDLPTPTRIVLRNPWGNQGGQLFVDYSPATAQSFSGLSAAKLTGETPTPTPTPIPLTATITAKPPSIKKGGASLLTWKTTGSTSVTLNGLSVALNGSMTVKPAMKTTYALVASNGTAAVTATAQVNIKGAGAGNPHK